MLRDGRVLADSAWAEQLRERAAQGRVAGHASGGEDKGALGAAFGAFPGLTGRAYSYVARHRNRWARLLRLDANCELRRR